MNSNALRLLALGLACALGLAGCGSNDEATPVAQPTVAVDVDVDVEMLGELALPGSNSGSAEADPLAELAGLLPPDTSAAATLPSELMAPA